MTWLLLLGLVVSLLAVVGLTALGSKRWTDSIGALIRRLEATQIDGTAQPLRPTHFNAHVKLHIPQAGP